MIRASCEVYIDGTWLPSTPADAVARRPVALAPFTLEWGRTTASEQPDAETASFGVRVYDPPDDLLSIVHVGSSIDIYATGNVPSAGFDANTYADPGFDTAPDGPAGALADTVAAAAEIAGVQLQVTPSSAPASVWVPPKPFTATPAGWDDIPTALAGETWRAAITITAPIGVPVDLALAGYTTPAAGSRVGVDAGTLPTITGTGAPQNVTVDLHLTSTPGPVWLALGVTLPVMFGRWVDQVGTWAEQVGTWPDYGQRGSWVALDNLELAPPAATVRRVLVHSGEVTDLAWAAVDDTTVDLDLISVDLTADLGNRPIGDEPWPVQTVETRAARIVELTGLPVALRIDDGVAGYQLSGRDVDAQPALDLLRDVAQSAGGVLWPATHATTGPYLWLEDPRNRAAVKELVVDPDSGLIVIRYVRENAPDLVVVSACDLLRDPVAWRQSVADVVTLVDVTWLEQTLNEDGELDPTERHVIRSDTEAAAIYGTNRTSLSTELISAADATALADRMLAQASALTWRVDGITYDTRLVDADIDSLDNTSRMAALMQLLDGTTRIGLGVTLIDLPSYAPPAGDSVGSYVEGGTYTYDNDAWTLSLRMSPSPVAGQSATWAELDPAWTWDQFDPDIRWADLYGTTVGGAP